MDKKLIAGLVVLAVVGVGAYILLTSYPKEETLKTELLDEKADGQLRGGGAVATPPDQSGLVLVEIKGFNFVGETTTISPGTQITWENKDSALHTVSSLTGLFESGVLNKGQKFSFVFTQKGIYQYKCSLHPEMTGQIIVK